VARSALASVPSAPQFSLSGSGGTIFRGVRLYNQTVLQSFTFDNLNQFIFTVHVMQGGIQLPDESSAISGGVRQGNGDLCVTKLDLSGNILVHMYLRGFGHGVQIGSEPEGSTTYLWTETAAPAKSSGTDTFGTKIARFPFVSGQVLDATSSSLQVFAPVPGSTSNSCNIDIAHGYFLLRYVQSGAHWYALFDLSDVKAGSTSSIVTMQEPTLPSTFQGYACFGNYIYALAGEAYAECPPSSSDTGDTCLTTMDINSGAIVDSFPTGAGKTLEYREPEGMTIQIPDLSNPSQARLCFGFASEESCTVSPKYAKIFYKDSFK